MSLKHMRGKMISKRSTSRRGFNSWYVPDFEILKIIQQINAN
jgi:hypothetical protein